MYYFDISTNEQKLVKGKEEREEKRKVREREREGERLIESNSLCSASLEEKRTDRFESAKIQKTGAQRKIRTGKGL